MSSSLSAVPCSSREGLFTRLLLQHGLRHMGDSPPQTSPYVKLRAGPSTEKRPAENPSDPFEDGTPTPVRLGFVLPKCLVMCAV